jgi:hypothetical protein
MALELLTNPELEVPEIEAAAGLALASDGFVNIGLGDVGDILSAISSPINRFIFLPINFIPFFKENET